jgi:hypothetical protein
MRAKTKGTLTIFTAICLLSFSLYAMDKRIPTPPYEFFELLAKTEIPPGAKGFNKLRSMLAQSVTISPYLAAQLYHEGKLMLGDTRKRTTYNKSHALGAISLPVEEVDFMKLKPSNIPILVYCD